MHEMSKPIFCGKKKKISAEIVPSIQRIKVNTNSMTFAYLLAGS